MFSTTLLDTFDCTCTPLAFSFSPRDLHTTSCVTAFSYDMLPWLKVLSRSKALRNYCIACAGG